MRQRLHKLFEMMARARRMRTAVLFLVDSRAGPVIRLDMFWKVRLLMVRLLMMMIRLEVLEGSRQRLG